MNRKNDLLQFYYEEEGEEEGEEEDYYEYDEKEEDYDYYEENEIIPQAENIKRSQIINKETQLLNQAPKIAVKMLYLLQLDYVTYSLIFEFLNASSLSKFINSCQQLKKKLFDIGWRSLCYRDFKFIVQSQDNHNDSNCYELYKNYFIGIKKNIFELKYADMLTSTKNLIGYVVAFKVIERESSIHEIRRNKSTLFVSQNLKENSLVFWELTQAALFKIKKEYKFGAEVVSAIEIKQNQYVIVLAKNNLNDVIYIFDMDSDIDFTKEKRIIYEKKIFINYKKEHNFPIIPNIELTDQVNKIMHLNFSEEFSNLDRFEINPIKQYLYMWNSNFTALVIVDFVNDSIVNCFEFKDKIIFIYLINEQDEIVLVSPKKIFIIKNNQKITHTFPVSGLILNYPSILQRAGNLLIAIGEGKDCSFTLDLVNKQLKKELVLNKKIKFINQIENDLHLYWITNFRLCKKIVNINEFDVDITDKFDINHIDLDKFEVIDFDINVDAIIYDFDKDKLLIIEHSGYDICKLTIFNTITSQSINKNINGSFGLISEIIYQQKKLLIKKNTKEIFFIDLANFFVLNNWNFINPEIWGIYYHKEEEKKQTIIGKNFSEIDKKVLKLKNKEYIKEVLGHNRDKNRKINPYSKFYPIN